MGRSGGTGERGVALGPGSSGGVGEGSSQLRIRWAGFLTGGVIRRRLDRWEGPMSSGDAAEWACPMSDWDVAAWASPMPDGDVAGWAGSMSDGDAAMWVAPTLGSAVFSMSSKRSYKKRTEVAVSGGKGLKGCRWHVLVSERGPVQVSWCAVSGLLDHLLLPGVEHTLQVQERGRGTLGGVRSGYNVTALMNTLCQPTCRGGGCPTAPPTSPIQLHTVPPTAAPTCTHE